MADPSRLSTVTIDGNKFNVVSTQVSLSTIHDDHGMPMMGAQSWSITVTVDIHDTTNMKFSVLSTLFGLANQVTKDKIKDIKVEYWVDEQQEDAICVYQFSGWISHFTTLSGTGTNHLLNLTLQPALDAKQYTNVIVSN